MPPSTTPNTGSSFHVAMREAMHWLIIRSIGVTPFKVAVNPSAQIERECLPILCLHLDLQADGLRTTVLLFFLGSSSSNLADITIHPIQAGNVSIVQPASKVDVP